MREVSKDINHILAVHRSTKCCQKAIHYGVSLSRTYGADLYILHAVYDPLMFGGWNLPAPTLQHEYAKVLEEAKQELDTLITEETSKNDIKITRLVKEGKPGEVILKTVEEEKIDLLVMLAHEEGRLEHFIFGRENEDIIRKMPCSIFLVKEEPGSAGSV